MSGRDGWVIGAKQQKEPGEKRKEIVLLLLLDYIKPCGCCCTVMDIVYVVLAFSCFSTPLSVCAYADLESGHVKMREREIAHP